MPDDRDRRAIRRAPASGDVVPGRPRRPVEPDELDEGPLQQDIERFDNPTRVCPECRKDVFDDSALCYHCGHALDSGGSSSGKPKPWVLVVAGVVILAFVLVALRGVF